MGLSHYFAKKISDYGNPNSIASQIRRRRIQPLINMIEAVYEAKRAVNILDIGGTRDYWNILPESLFESHKIKVTIVNISLPQGDPAMEKHFVRHKGDACNLSEFSDNSFDIAHSNSVIEHVGDWDRVKMFASELLRLAPAHFVQTPNYWFPIEPHFMMPFFHWLPRPSRIWLVMKFHLGHHSRQLTVDGAVETVNSARLLNKRLFSHLFSNSAIITERLFLLPKSFIAIRKYPG